jgi:hypothetical protein
LIRLRSYIYIYTGAGALALARTATPVYISLIPFIVRGESAMQAMAVYSLRVFAGNVIGLIIKAGVNRYRLQAPRFFLTFSHLLISERAPCATCFHANHPLYKALDIQELYKSGELIRLPMIFRTSGAGRRSYTTHGRSSWAHSA